MHLGQVPKKWVARTNHTACQHQRQACGTQIPWKTKINLLSPNNLHGSHHKANLFPSIGFLGTVAHPCPKDEPPIQPACVKILHHSIYFSSRSVEMELSTGLMNRLNTEAETSSIIRLKTVWNGHVVLASTEVMWNFWKGSGGCQGALTTSSAWLESLLKLRRLSVRTNLSGTLKNAMPLHSMGLLMEQTDIWDTPYSAARCQPKPQVYKVQKWFWKKNGQLVLSLAFSLSHTFASA